MLAIEAGRTILLDREIMLDKARSARIAIVGISKLERARRASQYDTV